MVPTRVLKIKQWTILIIAFDIKNIFEMCYSATGHPYIMHVSFPNFWHDLEYKMVRSAVWCYGDKIKWQHPKIHSFHFRQYFIWSCIVCAIQKCGWWRLFFFRCSPSCWRQWTPRGSCRGLTRGSVGNSVWWLVSRQLLPVARVWCLSRSG